MSMVTHAKFPSAAGSLHPFSSFGAGPSRKSLVYCLLVQSCLSWSVIQCQDDMNWYDKVHGTNGLSLAQPKFGTLHTFHSAHSKLPRLGASLGLADRCVSPSCFQQDLMTWLMWVDVGWCMLMHVDVLWYLMNSYEILWILKTYVSFIFMICFHVHGRPLQIVGGWWVGAPGWC